MQEPTLTYQVVVTGLIIFTFIGVFFGLVKVVLYLTLAYDRFFVNREKQRRRKEIVELLEKQRKIARHEY